MSVPGFHTCSVEHGGVGVGRVGAKSGTRSHGKSESPHGHKFPFNQGRSFSPRTYQGMMHPRVLARDQPWQRSHTLPRATYYPASNTLVLTTPQSLLRDSTTMEKANHRAVYGEARSLGVTHLLAFLRHQGVLSAPRWREWSSEGHHRVFLRLGNAGTRELLVIRRVHTRYRLRSAPHESLYIEVWMMSSSINKKKNEQRNTKNSSRQP